MASDYPFKVVRNCGTYDEPIAQAINLLVARGAFQAYLVGDRQLSRPTEVTADDKAQR